MEERVEYEIPKSYAEQGVCALCLKKAELQMSHIVPDAVTKWIARTSLTGKLRDFNNPNRVRQGGLKSKMLCKKCELIFSEKEKYFQENIFIPVAENHEVDFEYTPDLVYYFVSICWRWAVLSRTEYSTYEWGKSVAVQNYIDKYRPLLISGNLPKSEQGLLMLTGPVTGAPKMFKQLNSFYTRQAGASIRFEIDVCIFHVRLPYFWFFHGPLGLSTSQIRQSGIRAVHGYFMPSEKIFHDDVMTRLVTSVMHDHNDTSSKLSKIQADKITERALRNASEKHSDDFHAKEILLMDWERDKQDEKSEE